MRKQVLALAVICAGVLPVLALPMSVAGAAPSAVTSQSSSSAAGVSGAAVVQFAERFLGYPYTTVGNSPSTGFSCIGFVSYVYQSLGIAVPDDLGGAMAFAPAVSFSDLLPGDVLFFQNTVWPGLSHTAIYIGGGRLIHAEWYNRGVVISSFTNDPIDGNYWTDHYLSANRPWAGGAANTALSPPSPGASGGQSPAPGAVPAPPSPPAQSPTGPSARVRVAFLNVRSGPSLNAGIRTAIRRGTRLTILGHRHGWYRVALPNGVVGWVVGAGIGKHSIPTVRPRTSVQSLSTARRPAAVRARVSRVAPARTATRTRASATVLASGLRVHTAPSVGAPVRQTVAAGTRLTFLRRWSGWVDVRLPSGASGWVSGVYVSVSGPARSSRTAVRRSRVTRTAAVRTTTRLQSGATARAPLNVRLAPSLTSGVLSVAPSGARFSILGWSSGWAHVLLSNGGRGWISGNVIGVTAPSTRAAARPTASTTKSVITAGVRLHAGPGLARPVITLVAAGTRVQVIGFSGGWVRVRLPSRQTGYVYGSYVHA